MRYTTFLLDLDHTLFDTEASETAAFEQTMSAAGVTDAESHWAAYQRINLELWAAVEREEIQPQVVRTRRFELFVAEQELDADPQRMADDFVTGLGMNGDLYAGAREVLEHLSERASLGMVTNGLSEVQRTRIERLGLDDYFDAIAISAEIGAAKPGTEIFDIVFESMKRPTKKSAVMVGDNLSADIQGGVNFGIATCWYNPHSRSVNAADSINHEIRELQELKDLVV
ncbi:MAG: YjjG family noncanonical pyrimidine nucleotidase [Woeseiaceae bacterium]